jgi:hypothetical protein
MMLILERLKTKQGKILWLLLFFKISSSDHLQEKINWGLVGASQSRAAWTNQIFE